jgi:hypothetical protein
MLIRLLTVLYSLSIKGGRMKYNIKKDKSLPTKISRLTKLNRARLARNITIIFQKGTLRIISLSNMKVKIVREVLAGTHFLAAALKSSKTSKVLMTEATVALLVNS